MKQFVIRAICLATLSASTCAVAASPQGGKVYTLPDPWIFENDEEYSNDADYKAPNSRKGLIVHGFNYDAYHRLGRPTYYSESEPKVCIDRNQSDGPAYYKNFPLVEFWFIKSGVETLLLERFVTDRSENLCDPAKAYKTRITRSFKSNDHITLFQVGMGIEKLRTISKEDGLQAASAGMLPLSNLRNLRKRYRKNSLGPMKNSFGYRTQCFYTGNSLDRSSQCYLMERGDYSGLRLEQHSEHTASWENGREITYLAVETQIDGRLFEWDRQITLPD
jgi:hypothetical protein